MFHNGIAVTYGRIHLETINFSILFWYRFFVFKMAENLSSWNISKFPIRVRSESKARPKSGSDEKTSVSGSAAPYLAMVLYCYILCKKKAHTWPSEFLTVYWLLVSNPVTISKISNFCFTISWSIGARRQHFKTTLQISCVFKYLICKCIR